MIQQWRHVIFTSFAVLLAPISLHETRLKANASVESGGAFKVANERIGIAEDPLSIVAPYPLPFASILIRSEALGPER
jgi:hypothetical protein